MTIPPSQGLQDSDYFQALAIASSSISAATLVVNISTPVLPPGTIAGIFGLIAAVSTSLSQFFRSKGH